MISLWIFTESGTGKVRLDTHYSLLNIFLKSLIEDGHDMTTEEGIFEALKYRGGMYGTIAMLLDTSTLNGHIVQTKFKATTVSQYTHNVRRDNAVAKVYEASNISTPEIIEAKNLDKHVHNKTSFGMKRVFTSEKKTL